jgi:hypothetical protein
MVGFEEGGHGVGEGLTPIGPRIHCAATPPEVQQVHIAAFLDALTDVALSVARRTVDGGTGEVPA